MEYSRGLGRGWNRRSFERPNKQFLVWGEESVDSVYLVIICLHFGVGLIAQRSR